MNQWRFTLSSNTQALSFKYSLVFYLTVNRLWPRQRCSIFQTNNFLSTYSYPIADEICQEYPHNLIPTPGYWIECSRQQIATSDTIWDESESDRELTTATDLEQTDRQDDHFCLFEEENETEEDEVTRKKTIIEEQWEKNRGFELTSVEQETYEKYFYGSEHWNYFTNDEDLGPVILSIKQEMLNSRDQFRILVRAISYTVHGLIPTSCVFADR